jgi:hypothetical protein
VNKNRIDMACLAHKREKEEIAGSVSLILVLAMLPLSAFFMTIVSPAYGLDIDVRCTIYEDGNVDVRIYSLGLKANSSYTARVVPDESPAVSVTGESDSQGVYWVVAKVNNGDEDSIFEVTLYEGKNAAGQIITQGDDREPCHQILTSSQPNE